MWTPKRVSAFANDCQIKLHFQNVKRYGRSTQVQNEKKKKHKAAALIKDAQDQGTVDLKGSSQALSPGQVLEMML